METSGFTDANNGPIDFKDIQAQLDKYQASKATCPSCGYCPHCGRGGYRTIPSYPYYPYTNPYQPYWQPQITWTIGSSTTGTNTV